MTIAEALDIVCELAESYIVESTESYPEDLEAVKIVNELIKTEPEYISWHEEIRP